jgi:hypothetical protein
MAAQSVLAQRRWRPGPCSVSPVALVALEVADLLAEALVIPSEALATGVAAGGAAAAVPAAGAVTRVMPGGVAGGQGATAIGGLPVVPAGVAGVVGGGGNAGRCRRGGRGVAVAIAERGGIVSCSCMAASASSSEGILAQLARAERTVSGRVLRKMALNKMSLLAYWVAMVLTLSWG